MSHFSSGIEPFLQPFCSMNQTQTIQVESTPQNWEMNSSQTGDQINQVQANKV